jgi:DNA-binding MarR family transcriptional regulator
VTKGYTGVTNHLLDDILPSLEIAEQVILLRLYRLTRGHKQSRCKVSVGKLTTKTRVKRTRLREAISTLEERGYIKRLPDDVTNQDNYDRGMNIEMLLDGVDPGRQTTPAVQRPRSSGDPNKERALKENNKKGINRLSPEEIQSFTATVADLLGEGQTIEEVEARFAPNMHAVDWATIRSTALAQATLKRGK